MRFHEDNTGTTVVEATILLPFCLIMVISMYYAAIFMCQKANLQANLENTLIYYKNIHSDTYVLADTTIHYNKSDTGTIGAEGSDFEEPTIKNPYRFLTMKFDGNDLNSFFHSMCGKMFFDTGDNIEFTSEAHNYVLYKTISATATQTVKPAISLGMLGVNDTLTISASATVVVTDGDDFIRNTDFVIDVVSDTALGNQISVIIDRTAQFYNNFKTALNI